ncbi:hypothetical protein HanRHA438_Chr15g0698481 [Helianthus annuus]|nr:hypothetical protein HanRHA438_Chr15g0698481 [Helianthus annuus]
MLFTILGRAGHIHTIYVELYLLLSSVGKDTHVKPTCTYTYYYPRLGRIHT